MDNDRSSKGIRLGRSDRDNHCRQGDWTTAVAAIVCAYLMITPPLGLSGTKETESINVNAQDMSIEHQLAACSHRGLVGDEIAMVVDARKGEFAAGMSMSLIYIYAYISRWHPRQFIDPKHQRSED